MIHLPQLIQDLGVILVTAAIVTILCKKLKQPVVLGYLLAGLLVSPNIPFMPTIKDTSAVNIWAEIGVIILLFGLGLEFSFKKLAKVGRTATITASFEIVSVIALGYVVGQMMGWNSMDSIFLGAILSMSSTTIIVRAVDELGLKSKRFVSLVFGVLIIEDIVAILLLVLLSTVAISQTFSGTELLSSSARLGFFLILWFVMGIYLVPSFINRIRRFLNDETILVVSLGLCLLMVIIATQVGFSPALGAFIMGSLLAETREGERIEKLIHPVRDLFAAVFFVSVGMLIDLNVLVEYRYEVLIVTLVTIVGKFFGTGLGALISGNSVRHSTQVGMSMAQIGEFSFIIATLGMTLKVTSPFLYPIAVAASAVTTFTTPYMIKFADPFCTWLEAKIPTPALNFVARYQAAVQSEGGKPGIAKLLWRAFGFRVLINTIVVVAIFLFAEKIVLNMIVEVLGYGFTSSLLLTVSALLIAAPFLWAISFGQAKSLSEEDHARLDKLSFGIQLTRGFFALILAAVFINGFLSINSLAGIIVFLVLAVILAASRFSNKVYSKIEARFLENLEGPKHDDKEAKKFSSLVPWDVGLAEFVIHPNSKLVGMTLMESKLKESFGVSVTIVQRGDVNYVAPDRNWVIMSYDKLFIIGTDEQLEKIKQVLDEKVPMVEHDEETFGLKSMRLTETSPLVGKSIRDSGLRHSISGLIVGIERNDKRILNPDSSMVLELGDLLWVVGDIEKVKEIKALNTASEPA
ncbi:cation:proton antiporter [Pseudobdellovibrio exovorus]|uniref:RCK C-terminal domain-containing protein n=1 Tax=Pseudobdellovibrio exovorus JSS TaxID=1184267 RepID=M4VQA2_9BACT|nr:cation:proton antiporter [Pseudobdellovibrio exovorus]AGH95334.1 hypothetical protein A11Q_1118 [Pseudobdellovibrio exovorus JSS]